MLAVRMKEEGHTPGNASRRWMPEGTRKWILPWSLQKEHEPAGTLVLTQ